jgi:hypothetical protein
VSARKYLFLAAQGSFAGIADSETWRDIGLGMLALLVLALRVLILVTFPISTPLIAWAIWADERKRAREMAAYSARAAFLRHQQNGPGN